MDKRLRIATILWLADCLLFWLAVRDLRATLLMGFVLSTAIVIIACADFLGAQTQIKFYPVRPTPGIFVEGFGWFALLIAGVVFAIKGLG